MAFKPWLVFSYDGVREMTRSNFISLQPAQIQHKTQTSKGSNYTTVFPEMQQGKNYSFSKAVIFFQKYLGSEQFWEMSFSEAS